MAKDHGIWVVGTGMATGPRDECVLTLGAEVRAATAAAALAGCAAALERMRTTLTDGGVPASGLSTDDVRLNPVYGQHPVVVGFLASIQLRAVTHDLSAAGALISAVVESGGDSARLHDVSFRHRDPAGLVRSARDAAWADALERAEQLAGLSGRELGEVLSIDEGSASRPPGPMPMARQAMAMDAASVPLDSGEGSVTVSLCVGWALR